MSTFDLAIAVGLSDDEAATRLGRDGYNELPSSKPRSLFAIALEVVREPMFLLLVACGSIYLSIGDVREAMMLLGFVFIVMGITIVQERRSERALDALREMSVLGFARSKPHLVRRHLRLMARLSPAFRRSPRRPPTR